MNKKVRLVVEVAIVVVIIAFIFGWLVQCHEEPVKLNNVVILNEKEKIINHQKIINSLELELLENNKEVLDLQNKLHMVETNFSNFKKFPKYKQRVIEIIKTIPIDTLANNTIELEHCIETSQIKDSIITDKDNSINIFEIQKDNYRKIIESQLNIEDQLNDNLLYEINQTKKANRKATYWKIGTGILGSLLIYDKIIK